MKVATDRARASVAVFITLLLTGGATACGPEENSLAALDKADREAIGADPENGKVTLTIGSGRSSERRILAEVYAQALQAAGYTVKKNLNLASESAGRDALKLGQISGFPVRLSAALGSWYGFRLLEVRGTPSWTYNQIQPKLATEGLTAFPPTPFAQGYILAALRRPAENRGWSNLFALEYRIEDRVIAGPPECRTRSDCLIGLRKKYALVFKSYIVAPLQRGLDLLASARTDFAFVATTDPRLSLERDKFVVLPDSKRVIAAANLVFVTTLWEAQQAGPDFRATITKVQKGLTSPVMQELVGRVELEEESPAKVASVYLEEAGYID